METIWVIIVGMSLVNMILGILQKNVAASLGWFCSSLGWFTALTG